MKIKCKNITHAMKAEKLLGEQGIRARVEKNSHDPDVRGCVYSIVFSDSYVRPAVDLMLRGGVKLHSSEQGFYGDCR